MKKIVLFILALILCLSLASCDGVLEGIGDESALPETTASLAVTETLPPETEPTGTAICVDWMDFIRVNGVVYDGGWENREVDESRIGEKLGEILYTVKSYYESEEEFQQADKRDFTAAFRSIGSEIFAVKDDENSIAVLDGGKYYLYSQCSFVDFEVYGGEKNTLPCVDDKSFGVVINSFDQLCEAFGGSENVPDEIKTKYSGTALDDTTLIIACLVSGWGGTEFGISSVEMVGSDIHIYAVQLDSDVDGDDAMHYWTFYVEADKIQAKNVILHTDKCEPLKNDTGLYGITFEQINRYILNTSDEDFSIYCGKPVTNQYAAEEVARSIVAYSGYGVFVRFCPTNNYWLVELTRSDGNNTSIIYAVIRAADGRVISQIEVMN